MHLDKEGKNAFLLADRSLKTVEIESGKTKPVKLEAKMELDAAAERDYLFEHAWRQTREEILRRRTCTAWTGTPTRKPTSASCPTSTTTATSPMLVSELQGELNASHLGCYCPARNPNADATATLAFFPDPDWDGTGVRIAEIIDGGPLENADTKVKAGTVIEAIDGQTIAAGANWYPLLNHKAGEPDQDLALRRGIGQALARDGQTDLERAESELLYQRWVRSRRAEVERLSDGRLGYAHIRTMSDTRYREIFEDIFGKAVGKEAIVLDTRFNNGGNLVEALTVLLTGEVYARALPRGQKIGVEPVHRWTKPSIVVMNEGNYSDAHCFPVAYTSLGIGKTVGMQVPGTCTSVWWETLQDQQPVLRHSRGRLYRQRRRPDGEQAPRSGL